MKIYYKSEKYQRYIQRISRKALKRRKKRLNIVKKLLHLKNKVAFERNNKVISDRKNKIPTSSKICNLCKKTKVLIKSHIYPRWAYMALYPNGKVDSLNQLILVSTKNNYNKRRPIGIWDNSILCEECDSYLGRTFDNIGKKHLIETNLEIYKDNLEDKGKVYTLPSNNPIALKNFILSLLLRAHWSNIEEYECINISNKYVEELEEIIRSNTATSVYEYSVFITRFRSHHLKDAAMKFTQIPYKTKIDSKRFWIINLPNGYKIYIKVDKGNIGNELAALSLRENYPIYVLEWEDFENSNELKMLKSHLSKLKL